MNNQTSNEEPQATQSEQVVDNEKAGEYQVRIALFQGPLDLLLHLIEREELDITRVALAQVTDQYLAHLSLLKEVEPEMLTDFLVVAAKLVLIKSQALLPKPPPELVEEDEEDVGDQLARQLRLYKQFKSVANMLDQRQEENLRGFVRVAPPPDLEPRFSLGGLTVHDLLQSVREALSVKPPLPVVDELVSPVLVTIGQQMSLIQKRLHRKAQVHFKRLLRPSWSRTEIIVTFVAVLELIKQYVVDVRQDTLFGDIVIVAKGDAGTTLVPPESS